MSLSKVYFLTIPDVPPGSSTDTLNTTAMKSLYTLLAILLVSSTSAAQHAPVSEVRELTLEQTIVLAQAHSPEAQAARHAYRAAYWDYRFYKANYLPSLKLTSSPNMTNSISKITQSDGSNLFLHQKQLNTDLALEINQNLWFTGGSLFATSKLQRLDDFERGTKAYQSLPVVVGYRQALFGYNELKWNRRIQPRKFRESQKAYNEALELVASQACSHFFRLATAQANLDIATSNYASADTLYRYAKGRYSIGTITENEMLQLEINRLTEETNQMNARIAVEDQMQSLRSFLGLDHKTDIRLKPLNRIPRFTVPLAEAVSYAYANSPDPARLERQKIESESNLAYAKANAGLKADLYVQFGLSQTGDRIKSVYHSPMNQLYASVTLALPLLDWGRGKGRIRVARSKRDMVMTQVEQQLRDFELNVSKMVRQFNLQGAHVDVAEKTRETAERRYTVAKRLYLTGKSTILDLNAAIAEKDAARRSYINALSTYWMLYYGLRSMTGYDFEHRRKIEENYPEI